MFEVAHTQRQASRRNNKSAASSRTQHMHIIAAAPALMIFKVEAEEKKVRMILRHNCSTLLMPREDLIKRSPSAWPRLDREYIP